MTPETPSRWNRTGEESEIQRDLLPPLAVIPEETLSEAGDSHQASSSEEDEGDGGREADCWFQLSSRDMRHFLGGGEEYRWCQSLIFFLANI